MKRPRAFDDDDTVQLGMGTAHPATGDAQAPKGRLAGHLLIPDIDERHGWREWYVYNDPPPETRRPLGFRKP